jgi:hypothetical protein
MIYRKIPFLPVLYRWRMVCIAMKKTVPTIVLALATTAQALAGSGIYWLDIGTGKIGRSALDGSMAEDVVDGAGSGASIAIDAAGGKVYWADLVDGWTGRIRRADLDGSGIEDVLTRSGPIGAIAIDGAMGKIYYGGFTSRGEGGILRADLDGAAEEEVTFTQDVDGIALDLSRNRIFQLDRDDDFIFLHKLDGSEPETVVGGAWGMAFDPGGNHLYWLGVVENRMGIHRLRLDDGSAPETVVVDSSDISGLALDVEGGKVYWCDRSSGTIRRASLDGTGMEDMVRGLDEPFAVAIGPRPAGPPRFIRGDCETTGTLDLSDAVFLLRHLYLGGTGPGCLDACDGDDSGALDITDAIAILSHLFLGGPPPPAPFPDPGPDPTPDAIGCGI